MDKTVQEIYGNRVRVRVSGLCWRGDDLLMVNHRGLYGHDFWAPPGGGVDFGESLESSLRREFEEEMGQMVEVQEQLFICEFIKPPLHAVELFFGVTAAPPSRSNAEGQVLTGKDPEMGEAAQIIHLVKYMSIGEIEKVPDGHKHGLFRFARTAEKMRMLRGYLKI